MPIFDAAPELTSGPRALNLFTDRVPYLRAFCERIHAMPQPETIHFFHGVGGAGKSLLLRYLHQNACKLLTAEEWNRASRSGDDDAFREQILQARGVKSVASTWLDFSAMPTGEDRPREPFSALLMLRRQLGKQGIQTPLFDYAALWHLYRTQGKVPSERLRQLFPSEALDVATSIFYLFDSQVPGITLARSVIDIFAKNVEERFTLFWQRRGLDEDVVLRIQSMEPQPDLVDYLPILFAQDLNAAMATSRAPARLVLFFDTHEALFTNSESQYSTREDLGDAAYFGRDEWLRALFGHLELGQGIVPVLASRDAPRWAEAARWRIPAQEATLQIAPNIIAAQTYLATAREKLDSVLEQVQVDEPGT